MKKLHFVFMNGVEKSFDFHSSYTEKDGFVCFSYEGVDYKVKLDGGVEFQRTTAGERFVLRGDKTSDVTLLDLDKTFEIGVTSFEYVERGDEHVIKYELESDLGSEKTIILTFDV